MKYTAEEVRAVAKRLHDDITVADGDALMASDMLTDYAERIEADKESAVGYVATDNKIIFYVEDGWSKEVPPGTKLFTHPPAQAAQGETACPKCGATNPEDAAIRCCPDGDSCPGCEEPLAQAWDRKAAQPAQSVDIKAIREVIESHINEAKNLRHDPESQNYLYAQAEKLTAALQENGNG